MIYLINKLHERHAQLNVWHKADSTVQTNRNGACST